MDAAIALIALTSMEIVLGIDNIVFITILTSRLPLAEQPKARRVGLLLALGTRILLLMSLSWVLGLTHPLVHLGWADGLLESFKVDEQTRHHIVDITVRDLILLVGGLFLIGKATLEIHHKIEGQEEARESGRTVSFAAVITQIAILDSVITAVGMAKQIYIMIAAVIIAVGVMLVFANKVSEFVERHPTIKMLALSFLILIGVMLVAEGVGTEIHKGYIYFAMSFSLMVEFLNLRMRSRQKATATVGPD